MNFSSNEYESSKKPNPKVKKDYNKDHNSRVRTPNYTTTTHNNPTYNTANMSYETKTPPYNTTVSNDFSYYNKRRDSLLPEDKRNIYSNRKPRYNEPTAIPMMPLYGYDNYEDSEKDWGYFRQLYPRTALIILKEIDHECDQLEYDGSFMFDEYPDKTRLMQIVDRLYNKLQNEINVEIKQYRQDGRRPSSASRNWLRDLIEILLFQEFQNRRRRYRSRRRWF